MCVCVCVSRAGLLGGLRGVHSCVARECALLLTALTATPPVVLPPPAHCVSLDAVMCWAAQARWTRCCAASKALRMCCTCSRRFTGEHVQQQHCVAEPAKRAGSTSSSERLHVSSRTRPPSRALSPPVTLTPRHFRPRPQSNDTHAHTPNGRRPFPPPCLCTCHAQGAAAGWLLPAHQPRRPHAPPATPAERAAHLECVGAAAAQNQRRQSGLR